ncbi:MAG: hypothetical protein P0Y62_18930 [Candidatus Chryseobacterium colombiense]|nr:hypothetical protein [Chryseobacterium sp.]WEK69868.1 MAG: hypothetical protein P0Y62_18930 [Chryseobacterium sp.]
MKQLTNILLVGFCLLTATLTQAQKKMNGLVNDFIKVEGSWTGQLTYLDYSSGKPYTMSADLEIKRIPNTNEFLFVHTYPKEKSANKTDTIIISKDGQYIGKEKLVSRKKLSNGATMIITEKEGKDGNDGKKATIRQTYTLGNSSFSTQKDVLFSGETAWIKRHEYVYKRH